VNFITLFLFFPSRVGEVSTVRNTVRSIELSERHSCICGSPLLSLVESKEGYTFEETLLCPRCNRSLRDYRYALRRIIAWARDVEELERLLKQFTQFIGEFPRPAQESTFFKKERVVPEEMEILYPFVPTSVYDVVESIFNLLMAREDVDRGIEYDSVAERAEADYLTVGIGWKLVGEEGTIGEIKKIVEEYEGTQYIVPVYSENTDTYYFFVHPTERVYHFTRADLTFYRFTQLEEYIKSIVEDEAALMEGKWRERGFMDIMETKKFVYKGVEWEGTVRLRYLWRSACNGVYVLADFEDDKDGRYRAWRRLELSRVCTDEDEEERRKELVRQFFEP
jgi:hypothetical protein